MTETITPIAINLQKKSRVLKLEYDDGEIYEFSFEFLRVHSPSAEVRGHGNDDAVLQVGKENVVIDEVEPVGNYAVRLCFDDGHATGLYSWEYFQELGQHKDKYWQEYLMALNAAGHERKGND